MIIPIKTSKADKSYDNFIEYIIGLAQGLKSDSVEIIIANGSSQETFIYADKCFKSLSNVSHFIPHRSIRTGDNDKLNGIYAALSYAKYEKILLIDDHYRITRETLKQINQYYSKYDSFKCMPKISPFPITSLIDYCGMFVVNVLDKRKQYCGHLAFHKSLYL